MTFLFSSCTTTLEPPVGVWKSENPNLVFYFDSSYSSLLLSPNSYLGIYTVDGEEIKAVITFDTRTRGRITNAWVYEATECLVNPEVSDHSRNDLFTKATIQIINDQMHFSSSIIDDNGDHLEVETVFKRLEYYDPIDPEEWFPSPRGVWESKDPHIVLYIDPTYQSYTDTRRYRFLGIFILNGEEIKITASFGHLMRWLHITPASVVDESNRQVFNGAERMRGDLKMQGDQLHFELDLESQEETGFATIIFDRATTYGPIVPEDWGY